MVVEPGFLHSRFRPLGPGRSVIDEYWVIQAARCRTAVEASLPDASVEIYFNLGPSGRHLVGTSSTSQPARRGVLPARLAHRPAWVIGPHAESLLIEKETTDCDIVGVRLRAGVAPQVLGVPASELGSSLVNLDAFWGSDMDATLDRLSAATDLESRVEIVERAIFRRFFRRAAIGELGVVRGLCRSLLSLPNPSVEDVARAHGLTHRHVIALFDHYVGLKPKTFHRVQRLRGVLEAIGETNRASWAQIAARTGYCDQSHLIHEFRRLTGITPVEYERKRSSVGHGSFPHRLAASA